MKQIKILATLFSLGLILSCHSHAASGNLSNLTIVNAGTFGDGSVFVDLAVPSNGVLPINETNCAGNRFIVPTSGQTKNVLATAYAAMAAGKPVGLKTNGCTGTGGVGGQPLLDGTTNTWFYMQQN